MRASPLWHPSVEIGARRPRSTSIRATALLPASAGADRLRLLRRRRAHILAVLDLHAALNAPACLASNHRDRQRHQITPPANLHCSSGVTDSTLEGHFATEWCNVLLIPLSCTEMGGTREVSAPAEQVHVFPCAG